MFSLVLFNIIEDKYINQKLQVIFRFTNLYSTSVKVIIFVYGDKYYTTICYDVSVPPKNLNFRMSIPNDFREDWDFLNKRSKIEGMTPAELIRDLIEEYLEEFQEEAAKAEQELDEVAGPLRDKVSRKVTVKKRPKPKKKSFVARKAIITKKKEEPEDAESMSIQDTPKFRLLELVRSLDSEDGIAQDKLIIEAGKERIPNPRLQLNKMIRRGILHVHLNRIHVT